MTSTRRSSSLISRAVIELPGQQPVAAGLHKEHKPSLVAHVLDNMCKCRIFFQAGLVACNSEKVQLQHTCRHVACEPFICWGPAQMLQTTS